MTYESRSLLHNYLIVKYRVYETSVMNILSENFFFNSRKTDILYFLNGENQYIEIQLKVPLVFYFSRCM